MTAKQSDESTASASDDAARPGALLVVSGADASKTTLPERGALVLGRGDDAEIRIASTSLSRHHARFVVSEVGGLTVEDLASRNGTRIGGVVVAAHKAFPLGIGDVVECGGTLVLVTRRETAAPRHDASLVVSADARWFRREAGDAVNLGKRGALRLLLVHLVERRLASPGSASSVEAMFDAGWPGERIAFASAQARVYTSIQRLRALGLADVLITRGDGYFIDPACDVRRG